ncbi:Leucine-rich repeat [Dillenia turbinata]|uniref:Leucine-rich repeat n=1 Tax=Dillenia turbinata TaxID=194707 RepID=A0AAN8Z3B4_9MAGN
MDSIISLVLFISIGFFLPGKVTSSVNTSCNSDDLQALERFRREVEKPIDQGWGSNSSDCCKWEGVRCEPVSSRVIALELVHKNLKGKLSDSLFGLDQLRVLNLSRNFFTGALPPQLFYLQYLEVLDLSFNSFSGFFPSLIGIPSLRLTQLYLTSNMLSGSLSIQIGSLSNLIRLDISSNNFSGPLPNAFQNLRKLEQFSASSNNFSGNLPASLSNSPTLSVLNLQKNSLSGPIDINCSAMVNLAVINLGSNQFRGAIPESISTCRKLSIINFSQNNISNQIPDSFKNLKYLSQLSLSKNNISNLSAALSILQHCRNLTSLVLTRNFQNEVMPNDPSLHFKSLSILVIANCRLSGSIPEWLRSCTRLQLIDLSWNSLSGVMPLWFDELKFIFYLDLSCNLLSGNIPTSLTMLQSLISSNVSSEEASIDFPFYIQSMQYNQIRSFRPTLNLSYNLLSGPIWPELGELKMLHVLDLSHNQLSGHILDSLSNMINLETLDLSRNNLCGEIPYSLVKLNFLSKFSVAYNQLTGMIPRVGQFLTFPDSSFEGNRGLCDSLSPPDNWNAKSNEKPDEGGESFIGAPFGFGTITGFVITATVCYIFADLLPPSRTRIRRGGKVTYTKHWRQFAR